MVAQQFGYDLVLRNAGSERPLTQRFVHVIREAKASLPAFSGRLLCW